MAAGAGVAEEVRDNRFRAVGVRPCVLAYACHLPRHLHLGLVGLDAAPAGCRAIDPGCAHVPFPPESAGTQQPVNPEHLRMSDLAVAQP